MDKNILENIITTYNASRTNYEYYRYKKLNVKTIEEYNRCARIALRHFQICEGLEMAINYYPEDLYICYPESIIYRGITLTVLRYHIYEPDKKIDLCL